MNLIGSPRNKAILAGALLVALVLAAQVHGLSPVPAARWVLVLAGCGAALVWWKRQVGKTPRFAPAPRLEVLARTGLSQRCGVALLRAEGRTYLVAHGDGFAEIREAPAAAKRPARKTAGGAR